jgi:nitrite reductase (NADH) small subunit
MCDYTTVAKVGEIPEGHGKAFEVAGRMIAVFNDAGKFYAMDDCCPHMGASLAAGVLEDGVVACPDHAWRFRLHDGVWCDYRHQRIDCFKVRVEGDEVQVQVPS